MAHSLGINPIALGKMDFGEVIELNRLLRKVLKK
jgi:hypothetical protein